MEGPIYSFEVRLEPEGGYSIWRSYGNDNENLVFMGVKDDLNEAVTISYMLEQFTSLFQVYLDRNKLEYHGPIDNYYDIDKTHKLIAYNGEIQLELDER